MSLDWVILHIILTYSSHRKPNPNYEIKILYSPIDNKHPLSQVDNVGSRVKKLPVRQI